jgi:4-hydroxybenzoyl-CoA thioesterase
VNAYRTNRRAVRIQWGDCDPANIVYFPRYFAWFDDSTAAAFEAIGWVKPRLIAHFGIVGFPAVDVRATFMAPSTFGDDVVIETCLYDFGRSSFKVHHRLLNNGVPGVEGHEVRVWSGRDPANPRQLKGVQVPAEIIAALKVNSERSA